MAEYLKNHQDPDDEHFKALVREYYPKINACTKIVDFFNKYLQ
jgi:hypothetical protein